MPRTVVPVVRMIAIILFVMFVVAVIVISSLVLRSMMAKAVCPSEEATRLGRLEAGEPGGF